MSERTGNILIAVIIIVGVIVAFAIGAIKVSVSVAYKEPDMALKDCDTAYVVTDEGKNEVSAEDAEAIRAIIGEAAYRANQKEINYEFNETFALEFVESGGDKSVLVCPAADGSNVFKMKSAYYEMSEKNKQELYSITEKYGMSYPAE